MNGQMIGYARVNTQDQDLSLQINDLKKAGCSKKNIFTDKVSGVKSERVGLDACLKVLKAGGYADCLALGQVRKINVSPCKTD